jgi:hypothetical protein
VSFRSESRARLLSADRQQLGLASERPDTPLGCKERCATVTVSTLVGSRHHPSMLPAKALDVAPAAYTGMRPAVWAITACAALVLAIVLVRGPVAAIGGIDHAPGLLVDFGIYLDQARRLLAEPPTLGPMWLYPPLSAALLLGFGPLPESTARAIWGLLEVLLCCSLLLRCERQLSPLPKLERWLSACGLVLCSLPVMHCLKWGQLSLLVLLLSLLALERRGWTAAWLLGGAVGLKLYPLAYATIYLVQRDWRALWRLAVTTLVLGVLVPALLLGPLVAAIMLRKAFSAAARLSAPTVWNETIAALIAKYLAPASELLGADGERVVTLPAAARTIITWLAIAAVVGVTLYRVRRCPTDRALTAIATVLCFSLVLEPGWVHYFVVLPVAQALLLARAQLQRAAFPWLALSFGLGTLALVACLASPETFPLIESSGVVTLTALAGLFGLWSCMGRAEA